MNIAVLTLAGLAMVANMVVVFAATLRLAARGSTITERTLASPLILAMACVLAGLICSIIAILLVSPAAETLFGATSPSWLTPVVSLVLIGGVGAAAGGGLLVALDLGVSMMSTRAAPAPFLDEAEPDISAPRREAVG